MKVLISANVRWWNAEANYAWEKGIGLRQLGHNVVFLALDNSPLFKRATEDGIPVITTRGLNSLNPFLLTGTFKFLRTYLEEERIDIVDIHRSEGFALLAAAAQSAGKCVVRTRGDMRAPSADPINRWLHLTLCDALVASGKAVSTSMAASLRCPPERIEVVYFGVDTVHFSPGSGGMVRKELGFEADDFLIGGIGRVDRVKGIGNFLQAASHIAKKYPKTRFIQAVKEDHPDLSVYRQMSEKLGIAERFTFLGFRKDIEQVYRSLDLLVVTSLGSEANCRVTLEAMSSGLPVVAARTGVIPEVVEDGVTGYLFDSGDTGQLIEALASLADDPGLAEKMGASARTSVESTFSRKVLASKTEKIYLAALSGTSPKGEG